MLNRFFTGEDQKDIWLLKVDYEKLCNGKGKIQWDPAGQEGDVFPHLYDAELVTGVIVGVEKVVRDDGWDGALEGLRESGWLV